MTNVSGSPITPGPKPIIIDAPKLADAKLVINEAVKYQIPIIKSAVDTLTRTTNEVQVKLQNRDISFEKEAVYIAAAKKILLSEPLPKSIHIESGEFTPKMEFLTLMLNNEIAEALENKIYSPDFKRMLTSEDISKFIEAAEGDVKKALQTFSKFDKNNPKIINSTLEEIFANYDKDKVKPDSKEEKNINVALSAFKDLIPELFPRLNIKQFFIDNIIRPAEEEQAHLAKKALADKDQAARAEKARADRDQAAIAKKAQEEQRSKDLAKQPPLPPLSDFMKQQEKAYPVVSPMPTLHKPVSPPKPDFKKPTEAAKAPEKPKGPPPPIPPRPVKVTKAQPPVTEKEPAKPAVAKGTPVAPPSKLPPAPPTTPASAETQAAPFVFPEVSPTGEIVTAPPKGKGAPVAGEIDTKHGVKAPTPKEVKAPTPKVAEAPKPAVVEAPKPKVAAEPASKLTKLLEEMREKGAVIDLVKQLEEYTKVVKEEQDYLKEEKPIEKLKSEVADLQFSVLMHDMRKQGVYITEDNEIKFAHEDQVLPDIGWEKLTVDNFHDRLTYADFLNQVEQADNSVYVRTAIHNLGHDLLNVTPLHGLNVEKDVQSMERLQTLLNDTDRRLHTYASVRIDAHTAKKSTSPDAKKLMELQGKLAEKETDLKDNRAAVEASMEKCVAAFIQLTPEDRRLMGKILFQQGISEEVIKKLDTELYKLTPQKMVDLGPQYAGKKPVGEERMKLWENLQADRAAFVKGSEEAITRSKVHEFTLREAEGVHMDNLAKAAVLKTAVASGVLAFLARAFGSKYLITMQHEGKILRYWRSDIEKAAFNYHLATTPLLRSVETDPNDPNKKKTITTDIKPLKFEEVEQMLREIKQGMSVEKALEKIFKKREIQIRGRDFTLMEGIGVTPEGGVPSSMIRTKALMLQDMLHNPIRVKVVLEQALDKASTEIANKLINLGKDKAAADKVEKDSKLAKLEGRPFDYKLAYSQERMRIDRLPIKEQEKFNPKRPGTETALTFGELKALARQRLEKFVPDDSGIVNTLLTVDSFSRQIGSLKGSIEWTFDEESVGLNEKQEAALEADKNVLMKAISESVKTAENFEWDKRDRGIHPTTADAELLRKNADFEKTYNKMLIKELEKYDDAQPGSQEYLNMIMFMERNPVYTKGKEAMGKVGPGERLMTSAGVQDLIAKRVSAYATGVYPEFIVKDKMGEHQAEAGFFALMSGVTTLAEPHTEKWPGTKEAQALKNRNERASELRNAAREFIEKRDQAAKKPEAFALAGLSLENGEIVSRGPEAKGKEVEAAPVKLGDQEYSGVSLQTFNDVVMSDYNKRLNSVIGKAIARPEEQVLREKEQANETAMRLKLGMIAQERAMQSTAKEFATRVDAALAYTKIIKDKFPNEWKNWKSIAADLTAIKNKLDEALGSSNDIIDKEKNSVAVQKKDFSKEALEKAEKDKERGKIVTSRKDEDKLFREDMDKIFTTRFNASTFKLPSIDLTKVDLSKEKLGHFDVMSLYALTQASDEYQAALSKRNGALEEYQSQMDTTRYLLETRKDELANDNKTHMDGLQKEAGALAKLANDSIHYLHSQLPYASKDEHAAIQRKIDDLTKQSKILFNASQNASGFAHAYRGSDMEFMEDVWTPSFLDNLLGLTASDAARLDRIIHEYSFTGFHDLEFTRKLEKYVAKEYDKLTKITDSLDRVSTDKLDNLRQDLKRIREGISAREFSNEFLRSVNDDVPMWKKSGPGNTQIYKSSLEQPLIGTGWTQMSKAESLIKAKELIDKWCTKDRMAHRNPVTDDVAKLYGGLPAVVKEKTKEAPFQIAGIDKYNLPPSRVKDPETGKTIFKKNEYWEKHDLVQTIGSNDLSKFDPLIQQLEKNRFDDSKIDSRMGKALSLYARLRSGSDQEGIDQTVLASQLKRLDALLTEGAETSAAKLKREVIDKREGAKAEQFAMQYGESVKHNVPIWKQVSDSGEVLYIAGKKPPEGTAIKLEKEEASVQLARLINKHVTAEKVEEEDPAAMELIDAARLASGISEKDLSNKDLAWVEKQAKAITSKPKSLIDANEQLNSLIALMAFAPTVEGDTEEVLNTLQNSLEKLALRVPILREHERRVDAELQEFAPFSAEKPHAGNFRSLLASLVNTAKSGEHLDRVAALKQAPELRALIQHLVNEEQLKPAEAKQHLEEIDRRTTELREELIADSFDADVDAFELVKRLHNITNMDDLLARFVSLPRATRQEFGEELIKSGVPKKNILAFAEALSVLKRQQADMLPERANAILPEYIVEEADPNIREMKKIRLFAELDIDRLNIQTAAEGAEGLERAIDDAATYKQLHSAIAFSPALREEFDRILKDAENEAKALMNELGVVTYLYNNASDENKSMLQKQLDEINAHFADVQRLNPEKAMLKDAVRKLVLASRPDLRQEALEAVAKQHPEISSDNIREDNPALSDEFQSELRVIVNTEFASEEPSRPILEEGVGVSSNIQRKEMAEDRARERAAVEKELKGTPGQAFKKVSEAAPTATAAAAVEIDMKEAAPLRSVVKAAAPKEAPTPKPSVKMDASTIKRQLLQAGKEIILWQGISEEELVGNIGQIKTALKKAEAALSAKVGSHLAEESIPLLEKAERIRNLFQRLEGQADEAQAKILHAFINPVEVEEEAPAPLTEAVAAPKHAAETGIPTKIKGVKPAEAGEIQLRRLQGEYFERESERNQVAMEVFDKLHMFGDHVTNLAINYVMNFDPKNTELLKLPKEALPLLAKAEKDLQRFEKLCSAEELDKEKAPIEKRVGIENTIRVLNDTLTKFKKNLEKGGILNPSLMLEYAAQIARAPERSENDQRIADGLGRIIAHGEAMVKELEEAPSHYQGKRVRKLIDNIKAAKKELEKLPAKEMELVGPVFEPLLAKARAAAEAETGIPIETKVKPAVVEDAISKWQGKGIGTIEKNIDQIVQDLRSTYNALQERSKGADLNEVISIGAKTDALRLLFAKLDNAEGSKNKARLVHKFLEELVHKFLEAQPSKLSAPEIRANEEAVDREVEEFELEEAQPSKKSLVDQAHDLIYEPTETHTQRLTLYKKAVALLAETQRAPKAKHIKLPTEFFGKMAETRAALIQDVTASRKAPAPAGEEIPQKTKEIAKGFKAKLGKVVEQRLPTITEKEVGDIEREKIATTKEPAAAVKSESIAKTRTEAIMADFAVIAPSAKPLTIEPTPEKVVEFVDNIKSATDDLKAQKGDREKQIRTILDNLYALRQIVLTVKLTDDQRKFLTEVQEIAKPIQKASIFDKSMYTVQDGSQYIKGAVDEVVNAEKLFADRLAESLKQADELIGIAKTEQEGDAVISQLMQIHSKLATLLSTRPYGSHEDKLRTLLPLLEGMYKAKAYQEYGDVRDNLVHDISNIRHALGMESVVFEREPLPKIRELSPFARAQQEKTERLKYEFEMREKPKALLATELKELEPFKKTKIDVSSWKFADLSDHKKYESKSFEYRLSLYEAKGEQLLSTRMPKGFDKPISDWKVLQKQMLDDLKLTFASGTHAERLVALRNAQELKKLFEQQINDKNPNNSQRISSDDAKEMNQTIDDLITILKQSLMDDLAGIAPEQREVHFTDTGKLQLEKPSDVKKEAEVGKREEWKDARASIRKLLKDIETTKMAKTPKKQEEACNQLRQEVRKINSKLELEHSSAHYQDNIAYFHMAKTIQDLMPEIHNAITLTAEEKLQLHNHVDHFKTAITDAVSKKLVEDRLKAAEMKKETKAKAEAPKAPEKTFDHTLAHYKEEERRLIKDLKNISVALPPVAYEKRINDWKQLQGNMLTSLRAIVAEGTTEDLVRARHDAEELNKAVSHPAIPLRSLDEAEFLKTTTRQLIDQINDAIKEKEAIEKTKREKPEATKDKLEATRAKVVSERKAKRKVAQGLPTIKEGKPSDAEEQRIEELQRGYLEKVKAPEAKAKVTAPPPVPTRPKLTEVHKKHLAPPLPKKSPPLEKHVHAFEEYLSKLTAKDYRERVNLLREEKGIDELKQKVSGMEQSLRIEGQKLQAAGDPHAAAVLDKAERFKKFRDEIETAKPENTAKFVSTFHSDEKMHTAHEFQKHLTELKEKYESQFQAIAETFAAEQVPNNWRNVYDEFMAEAEKLKLKAPNDEQVEQMNEMIKTFAKPLHDALKIMEKRMPSAAPSPKKPDKHLNMGPPPKDKTEQTTPAVSEPETSEQMLKRYQQLVESVQPWLMQTETATHRFLTDEQASNLRNTFTGLRNEIEQNKNVSDAIKKTREDAFNNLEQILHADEALKSVDAFNKDLEKKAPRTIQTLLDAIEKCDFNVRYDADNPDSFFKIYDDISKMINPRGYETVDGLQKEKLLQFQLDLANRLGKEDLMTLDNAGFAKVTKLLEDIKKIIAAW